MIESLTYAPVEKSRWAWVSRVEYLQKQPVTQFKPGLNILFGANGSGKSTVLSLLAQCLAAEQGGTSVVTQSWLSDILNFDGQLELPAKVVHDGQPVMYFHARAQEGLIGGSFDDDFFNLGLANTMAKGSTGQLALRRVDRLLSVLLKKNAGEPVAAAAGKKPAAKKATKKTASKIEPRPLGIKDLVPAGFPAQVEWRIKRERVNDTWSKRLAIAESLLAGTIAQGPRTLIFDEPESGFGLPWQSGLWSNIFSKVDPAEFQVIVATHSPFALRIPGANYIELTPGYMAECEMVMSRLLGRFMP